MVIRECEADAFIAACHISVRALALPVIDLAQARIFCLPHAVLSDEHAVVMLSVLIQQAAVQKLADHLWSDAAFRM